ncbi:family 20 glycosylhydrolase [Fulvivirga sp.]|uniref:glycoside hydrolase family 20 protein n=1 Tax=Fulvivirga sp. TaxID=1931237 RepID=UPI0032EAB43C
MVKRACFVISILFVLGCTQPDSSQEHDRIVALASSIIPKPNETTVKADEYFEFNENTAIVADDQLSSLVGVVQGYLEELTGYQITKSDNGDNALILKLDEQLDEEQYNISVNDSQMLIKGGSTKGVLHGFQTIRQLLITQDQSFVIPAMTINDEPRFPWRGLQLDCSRHFMEKDFVKRYIDLLALYKMNVFHWHLTEDQGWRIEIKKYPKLTSVGAWRDDGNGGKYGGFYTQEEIKEVVEYAAARGITVVPEIEMPGHSVAALAAYPELSCTGGPFEVETDWGVFKDIYCAGNEATFTFLEDVLTEVMALFPSKYIHIGGDEAPKFRWEACEKCQQRIKDEGLHDEHELQSYFIKRIEKFLNANGRQIIGWDEILEGGLAPGATVQSWRGFEGAEAAVKSGHNAIVSPTSHAYFDYSVDDIDLEKVYSFEPLPKGLTPEEASLILGGECNMWTERAPQHLVDSKVFPRILAMTEVLWSDSTNRNYQEFNDRVQTQYSILNKLGVTYGFEKNPVEVSSEVRDGELMAKLSSYDPNIELYYSINNQKAIKYEQPVEIKEPVIFDVTFKKNDIFYSDTVKQYFVPHQGIGKPIELISNYSPNYTAGGDRALLDGKRGGSNFKDGNWQGYWATDAEVIVDLGVLIELNNIKTSFFQHNRSWIFFPEQVEFLLSEDGQDFKSAGIITNTIDVKEKGELIQNFEISVEGLKCRYLKMQAKSIGKCPDWHEAVGNDSWLFIDELIIN